MIRQHTPIRYDWVDISKGIAIILMVIGHSSLPDMACRWIYSFHMPFFFIVSALFTNWEKDGFGEFMLRKAKRLLLPFLIYSAINLAILPFALDIPYLEYLTTVIRHGWGVSLALWFVPVFFASLLICKLVPEKVIFISAFFLLTIGSLLSLFRIFLPWTLSSVPFGAAIMLFTRYFRKDIIHWINQRNRTGWLFSIIAGATISLFISHYFCLDMARINITPTIPLIAGIIGGSAVCIGVAHLADKWTLSKKLLTHIGRNTYEIMALSQVAILLPTRFIPNMPVVSYCIMIVVLIMAIYLRQLVERKFLAVLNNMITKG